MRYSRLFLPTLKEVPAEAEVVSHKLLLRAGMIRKLASGLYSYLPLGLRSLRKVEKIIREEMDRAGAQEVLLPIVQPSELWQESGRWERYGKELLRFEDRHGRAGCLGPTHEEVITDIVRKEIRSYRDLPLNLYQIQTKFRDEIRPRFGLMRSREFLMKDAYSFDVDDDALEKTYQVMHKAYCRIFERCGLDFRPVEADTGSIGGHASHEFMVMADTGEDQIACCTSCDYAANVELAPIVQSLNHQITKSPNHQITKINTPGKRSVEEVTKFLKVSADRLVKTLIVIADDRPVAALIRGDHELNDVKLMRLLGVEDLNFADEATVRRVIGAPVGFAGPVDLPKDLKVVADQDVSTLKDFVTGANESDAHFTGVNWGRDVSVPEFADIRVITEGDPCPKCKGKIELKRGIEVGHIFKLGTKYSEALGATFLDTDGKKQLAVMGCYGIGVGRTVAAAIEQNYDENGIIFPIPIAPFEIIISLLNIKDTMMSETAEDLYNGLMAQGVDVLLDDRKERPGVKFKDADLLGIPLRIVVGKRLKEKDEVEIKNRATGETISVKKNEAIKKAVAILR
ncbi:MAG: proline--tRNA ligase [Thermodesulfobacteriota bacterium]|nr:MAG: proline--tRNA ligase [Thermodesulfobacteriota bacterium]